MITRELFDGADVKYQFPLTKKKLLKSMVLFNSLW
jgi:hypothetical protein